MTSLLPDISAWTGDIVPGGYDPRYRKGPVVTPDGHRVNDEITQPNIQVEPRSHLGDERTGLLKEIHQLIKGEATAKIAEALPRYRLQS